ncbi:hypothetical protein BV25DRAFT_1768406, partial [Artomyces pyxidatus]
LEMALPAGLPTHEHFVTKKWSRLDQVFCSEATTDLFVSCETLPDRRGPATDHVPIASVLDLALAQCESDPMPNFRMVDWDAFRKDLKARLDAAGPAQLIVDRMHFTRACSQVTSILQATIAAQVPHSRINIHTRRWWTKELSQLRTKEHRLCHLSYRFRDFPDHPSHAALKDAKKAYISAIKAAKQQHWQDWLENATDPDIWTANKYISTPAGD